MRIYQLPVLLMVVFFCLQCKKDNQRTDILTTGKWKRGMIDKNISSNPPGRPLYYAVLNCEQDDELTFDPGGTLRINNGADKCDPDEPGTGSMTYSYDKAGKELVIDSVKYTIAEETEKQIKYFAILPSNTGYEYVVYLLVRP